MDSFTEQLESAAPFRIEDVELNDEDITEFNVKEWPTLLKDALHGIAGEVVRLATKDCEADPAAVLMTFLAEASAMIGSKPKFMVGETPHAARIWSLMVGASSRARKGTSAKPVRKIALVTQNKANDIDLSFGKVTRKSGPLSTGEGLIFEVRDPVTREDESGESHTIDEGVTDKRLLVIDGEFGSALKAMQREGNTLSTTMREAWDVCGDYDVISPMTKGNRCAATNPHIVIAGHITHKELIKLLSESDTYNGFGNRFLWCCVRRSNFVPFPKQMDGDEVDDLAKRLAQIIVNARERGVVSFSPQTAKKWQAIYGKLTEDRPGSWGVITARMEAQVIRLSLLYALLDGAHQIEIVHLKAALAVNRYCDQSARYIFGDSEPDADANKVLNALIDGDKTTTQLIKIFNNHIDKERLQAMLEHLQSAGRVTCIIEPTKGRPRSIWKLVDGFQPPGDFSIDSELS